MRTFGFLLLAGTAAVPATAQTTAPAAPEAAAPTPARESATATPAPAPAATPPAHEDEEEGSEIVVQGQRPVGSVVGDVKPEQTLSPADIRSYGVSSVADLLTELAPQTRSGRGSGGAPVVLVDGRRVSGFQEIRNLPTEAILRVEILPEEVALKYGYRADQRVVNFVLRRRFRAVAVELNDRQSTDGGRNQPEVETDLVHIRNGKRLNLHLEYSQADALTEAQRNVIQSPSNFAVGGNVVSSTGNPLAAGLGNVAGVPGVAATRPPLASDFTTAVNGTDQGAYRTLLPRTRDVSANGTYATSVFGNIAATINLTAERQVSDSQLGLPTASLALPSGSPWSPFADPVTVQRAFDSYGALAQRATSTDLHLGSTLNGMQGRWRWTVTLAADHSESDTATQSGLDATGLQARLTALDVTANPYGVLGLGRLPDSVGRSNSTSVELDTTANGPLFALPAGDASATVKIGSSTSDFSSSSMRYSGLLPNGLGSGADISRDIANAQLNIDLPIARRGIALSGLGNLSLNGNLAIDHLSDFGSLWTIGYGATWSPVSVLQLLVSVTDQDEAPSASQLGNPMVLTPGVRVFDYVNGTTATVTTISGGNRLLAADNRHVFKAGLNLTPFSGRDINFTANYVTQRTDDPIASFPAASAAIEAAFPDRFTRVNGTLIGIDQRPINFARSETAQLRYGINVSFALKSSIQRQFEAFRAGTGPNPFAGLRPPSWMQRPDGSAAPNHPGGVSMAPGNAPPPPGDGGPRPGMGGPGMGGPGMRGPGGPGMGGPGGPGGRFAAQSGGRVQFALYHTWNLTNRITVADGGPVLDLLNGDAVGNSGGASRHQLEGRAGYNNNGLGVRLSVNYQSGTHVNGGTPGNPETLDFGSLTTANVRLWADLGQRLDLVKKAPWLRGARISLSVDNLFNQRQRVTDQTGAVPIGFQPAYLDALGRTVRLSVRKLFF